MRLWRDLCPDNIWCPTVRLSKTFRPDDDNQSYCVYCVHITGCQICLQSNTISGYCQVQLGEPQYANSYLTISIRDHDNLNYQRPFSIKDWTKFFNAYEFGDCRMRPREVLRIIQLEQDDEDDETGGIVVLA